MVFAIMVSVIISIVVWCIYRIHKYPLAKGIRLLSPIFLPLFMLKRPLLNFANAFLAKMTHPKLLPGLSKENGMAGSVPYMLFRPKGIDCPPLLIYLHGGGFFFEAASGLYRACMEYALKGSCALMAVQYRTSDRHPYPAQDEDARTALRYVLQNADAMNIDKERIAVGGDSAGGCLAASLAQWARDEGINLLFQFLVYPVLDRRMSTKSMRIFPDSPIWNARLSRKMWEILGAETSPAECENLSCLPPAYIEVEEYDSLRDEGTEYSERLQKTGVAVDYHFVHGSCHGFDEFMPNPLSRKMMEERISFLRKSFWH